MDYRTPPVGTRIARTPQQKRQDLTDLFEYAKSEHSPKWDRRFYRSYIRELLQYQVDLDARDSNGCTVFACAMEANNLAFFEAIFYEGDREQLIQKYGDTLYMLADDKGCTNIRDFLIGMIDSRAARGQDIFALSILEERRKKQVKSALEPLCQGDAGAVWKPLYNYLQEVIPHTWRTFEKDAFAYMRQNKDDKLGCQLLNELLNPSTDLHEKGYAKNSQETREESEGRETAILSRAVMIAEEYQKTTTRSG